MVDTSCYLIKETVLEWGQSVDLMVVLNHVNNQTEEQASTNFLKIHIKDKLPKSTKVSLLILHKSLDW